MDHELTVRAHSTNWGADVYLQCSCGDNWTVAQGGDEDGRISLPALNEIGQAHSQGRPLPAHVRPVQVFS